MMRKVFVLLFITSRAFCDSCMTYTFENNFDTLFTTSAGICNNLLVWNVGHFEDTEVTDHNERSTKFIYPQEELSCVTSFMFPMASGGIIEMNIFMETSLSTDQIQVVAMEYVEDGNDAFMGQAMNTPGQAATYVPGWHTLEIRISGNNADMIGYSPDKND